MKNESLAQFMRERPHLVWYVRDSGSLDEVSVVEHVLNYGTWADVQALIQLLGLSATARIFRAHATGARSNYRKNIAHYFTKYFDRYA
jgi:hypothetical protein